MGWSVYTHAGIGDIRKPRPLGVCDKCGFVYNRDRLKWQYQWAGLKQRNTELLVCPSCMDAQQPQLRAFTIPIDPPPILNPRPGEYGGMVISSSPDIYDTIVPSQIVVQYDVSEFGGVFQAEAFQDNVFEIYEDITTQLNVNATQIGDRQPIVTETSSYPLLVEIGVVPNPDPNYGDGGYSRLTGEST